MQQVPLEGFYSQSFDAENKVKPLPELKCRAVLLSVWTEKDNAAASDVDDEAQEIIYWGIKGTCAHQLKAGETSIYIYVSNLNQISVRTTKKKTGKTTVYFSCFR